MKTEIVLLRSPYINENKFRDSPSFYFLRTPVENKEEIVLEIYEEMDEESLEIIDEKHI